MASGEWRARSGRSLVKNGLAMVANEVDFTRQDFEFFAGGERGFGVNPAEARVELAEFAWSEGILFGDAKDFFADGRRKSLFCMAEKFDF